MSNKQALVNLILSGMLMSREDQREMYLQYQDYSYGDEPEFPEHLHIFHSYYEYENYSGYGFVWGYNSKTNEFFYNSGSHCSCYGLEGQWDEDPYTYEQMLEVVQKNYEQADGEDAYWRDNDQVESLKNLLEIIKGE